jgi:hypothetical protein
MVSALKMRGVPMEPTMRAKMTESLATDGSMPDAHIRVQARLTWRSRESHPHAAGDRIVWSVLRSVVFD